MRIMGVEDIKNQMAELINDVKSHNDLLTSISDVLIKSLEKSKNDKNELDTKISSLKQELTMAEGKIKERNSSISEFNGRIEQINPKIEDQIKTIDELNTIITESSAKIQSLNTSVKAAEIKSVALQDELREKTIARDNLLTSIDEKVKVNLEELETTILGYNALGDKYAALDYLFNKIETPEVEIMAIIAANREIGLDEIKAQAKSVQAVFVGRAISKLEADGKIIMVENENWDIAPSLLDKL